jgi:tetratricopeptide (TPR) repeat protein
LYQTDKPTNVRIGPGHDKTRRQGPTLKTLNSAAAPAGPGLLNFTNREREREALSRLVEKADVPLPIVMFYGVGGAGKSWLVQKLKEELAEQRPFLPTARLDLEPRSGGTTYHTDSSKALAYIRQQFKNVDCPRFDLAYAWLRYKEGYAEEPMLKGSGPMADAFELVKAVGGTAAGIPGIGLLMKKAGDFVRKNFLRKSRLEYWFAEQTGQDDFLKLQSVDAQQLYPELAGRLLQDLAENLEPQVGHACRAIIFIDTFETITRGIQGGAQRHERESWVRDLYAADSPVLLVLAGRDRLTWEECDVGFADPKYLEQHLVGGLSEPDARTFLVKSGITDAPLQGAILRTSVDIKSAPQDGEAGYHPLSLYLCAETAANDLKAGRPIDPATFAMPPGDLTKLAQRFLTSLSDPAHEVWVPRLARTPRFDEAAARAAFSPVRDAAQDAAWQRLMRYSFVQPTAESGWWTLHGKMRDALDPGPTANDDHAFWRDHWQALSMGETDTAASLAWYHGWRLDPVRGVQGWSDLADRLKHGLRMADHLEIIDWWEPTGLFRTGPTTRDEARMLNDIGNEFRVATLGDRGENLRRAIGCHVDAIRVLTETAYPRDWAGSQNGLGNVYAELPGGDRGENLRRAIVFYQASLRVVTEATYSRDWAMAQNNLGNAYAELTGGDRVENLQRAIGFYEASLRVVTEAAYPQDWARFQNNLGNAYAKLPGGDRGEDLRRAIDYFEAALQVYTKSAFPRDWAMAQNNLGNAYHNLPGGDQGENLRRAIGYYEAALQVYTESAFPEQRAATQNDLGTVYADLPGGDRVENLRRAVGYFEAALMVRTENVFPEGWARTCFNRGLILAELADVTGDRTYLPEALAAVENAEQGFRIVGLLSDAANARRAADMIRGRLVAGPV